MDDFIVGLLQFLDLALRFILIFGIPAGVIYLLYILSQKFKTKNDLLKLQGELSRLHHENASLKTDNETYNKNLKAKDAQIESIKNKAKSFAIVLDKVTDKLVDEYTSFIEADLSTNNFVSSKKKIEVLFAFLEKNGAKSDPKKQDSIQDQLKVKYEEVLRKEFAKQEQARIKAQIREEQRLEAERQKELQKIENEELALEKALQRAMQRVKDEHSEEVMRLREKLKEAQEKMERAKSQAQLTKSGHVYIISNIGSFGENVFKIGMTRRLEPYDRIRELSDASVPFAFDVHMMISCNDAPSLENALHRELHKLRMNKVNMKKEFFRVDIEAIRRIVEKNHGTVDYVATPEALEYRETMSMTDEEYEFLTNKEVEYGLEPAEIE